VGGRFDPFQPRSVSQAVGPLEKRKVILEFFNERFHKFYEIRKYANVQKLKCQSSCLRRSAYPPHKALGGGASRRQANAKLMTNV